MHTAIRTSSPFRPFIAAAALASFSPLTQASTWVVDDNPGVGVDFTSIAAAVAESEPGDVLLVRAGTYAGFTLDMPLHVLGASSTSVIVTGPIQVQNLPADARAIVSGMRSTSLLALRAQFCTGRLVLEDLRATAGQVVIQNCADVRMQKLDIQGQNGSTTSDPFSFFIDGRPAIVVEQSWVEIVDSNLVGGEGGDCSPCQEDSGFGGYGGHGVFVTSGEAHVARTSMRGGNGGDATVGFLVVGAYGGDGGDGLRVGSFTGTSYALVTGDSNHVLASSTGGLGADSFSNGGAGRGLGVWIGCAAQVSGVQVASQSIWGTLDSPAVADPHMTQQNIATPGGTLPFRITAPPGSTVEIVLARGLDFVATPGLEEDVLVQRLRVFNLGVVDATGIKGLDLVAPAYLPVGFAFHAQAEIVYPDSTLRRTNSVTLILR